MATGGQGLDGSQSDGVYNEHHNLTVQIINGDITKYHTLTIAYIRSGRKCFSGYGVGKYLSRVVGQQTIDDCELLDYARSNFLVTDGGDIDTMKLFHCYVDGTDDDNFLNMYLQCFQTADNQGLEVLSLTAFGTGIAKKNPRDMGRIFTKAITTFTSTPIEVHRLSYIRVFTLSEAVFDAFWEEVRKLARNPIIKLFQGKQNKWSVKKKEVINTALRPAVDKSNAAFLKRSTSIELTKFWEWSGKETTLIQLDSAIHREEYQDVTVKFELEVPIGPNYRIVKIERIQNYFLWRRYQIMLRNMKDPYRGERQLWHGCHKDARQNICYKGFNRNYVGRNASVYGEGVYFALEADYSAQDMYSPPDENQHKTLFLCRVGVGEFTKGEQYMREAPLKPNSKQPYDSVVNNVTKPTTFVVFMDYSAYPEYMITFK